MSWVKIDDQFFSHPKVLRAGRDARDLYLAALTYCARFLTDGFVQEESLGQLASLAGIEDVTASVTALLTCDMWETCKGGYRIHDYLDYNPSAEQVKAKRVVTARRQEKYRSNAVGNASRNGVTNGVTNAAPLPVPLKGVDDKKTSSTPPAEPAGIPANGLSADGTRPAMKEQNASLKTLVEYFAKKTNLQLPSWDGRKGAESNLAWRQPLDEILCLVEWDVGRAQKLVDAALERLRSGERKLTVSDPRSIIRTARALRAERTQAKSHARKDADGNIIMPNR